MPATPSQTAKQRGSQENSGSSSVQAWLNASARRVGASQALLVVRQGDSVRSIATAPQGQATDSKLLVLAERALTEGPLIVRRQIAEDGSPYSNVLLALVMRVSGRPGAIALRARVRHDKSDEQLLKQIGAKVLRRAEDTQSSAAQTILQTTRTPASTLGASNEPATNAGQQASPESLQDRQFQLIAEQGMALNALASMLDQAELPQALHAFVNGISQNLGCQRVSISLTRARRLSIRAISGVVDFDPKSAVMVDILQAMEETRNAASIIALPCTDNSAPPHNHATLAAQLNSPSLLSVPLIDRDRVVGVILLEKDRPFTDDAVNGLKHLSLLVSPVIALKKLEEFGPLQWAQRFGYRQLKRIFGPKHLALKLMVPIAMLLITWSLVHTEVFRIDADASIEANVQRAVVTSFPSFISEVEKRAGDIVHRGDVLARLDIEELQLDRIRWTGEREKLVKEYRANLAQRDRSQIRILEARRAQAQTQIDLLDAQIARAVLRAPIDGVVISGDLTQALGSPVERGELLFEVASLEDYRLVLMVDEGDIGWVKIGSGGDLRLRSMPDTQFPFEVTSIAPVSEPGQGSNTFRVEASLDGLPDSLRPGMGGFAKIEIEPRSVAWIWTRQFNNWFSMQVWKYTGS